MAVLTMAGLPLGPPLVSAVYPPLLFLAQTGGSLSSSASDDWLTQAIRNVLVGQAVVGTVALIGLFAIIKRFLSHEFPATMASINARLDTLHRDFEKLQVDFTQSLLASARLSEKVENLMRRVDNLEDGTVSRRRERPREME